MKNYLENVDYEGIRAKAEQMLDYANDAKDYAARMSSYAFHKTQRFSLFDFGVFKICIFSLGVWLGACFSKCFRKFRGAIFAIFAATWIYVMWRIFSSDE